MPRTCKTISVTDLRVDARQILENAHFRGWHYVVERAGQPMIVIVGVEEYERFLALAEKSASDNMPSGSQP